jgi:hypothetical protein
MKYLDKAEYVFTGSGFTVSQKAMGTVNPQTTRIFRLFYQYELDSVGGLPEAENLLGSTFAGPILWVHAVNGVLILLGAISFFASQRPDIKDRLWEIAICVLLMFFINMSYLLG